MAYSSWSVVFGEQPSAAKWNILGTNDSSFNDGTGIANLAWNTTSLSNPYKFRAYRNAAANTGNGAFAIIVFDTELYDTNNNHATGTGVYTAPVTGFYHFSWAGNTTTSGAELFICSLFVNGSENARGSNVTVTTSAVSSVGATDVQLTAADTVDVRAFNTNTRGLAVGFTYTTFWNGHLISKT